jgi:predicted  nucleic acid-binding Zn-ribbon protein
MANQSDDDEAVMETEGLGALAKLEERITVTVEQLRAARREKADAQRESSTLRERLAQNEQQARQLNSEIDSLRSERRLIGERLERLLTQIDSLGQE